MSISAAARAANPAFQFVAEAYWDREWDLQQLGFRRTDAGRGFKRHGLAVNLYADTV